MEMQYNLVSMNLLCAVIELSFITPSHRCLLISSIYLLQYVYSALYGGYLPITVTGVDEVEQLVVPSTSHGRDAAKVV